MKITIILNFIFCLLFVGLSLQAQDTLDVAPFNPDGELNLAPTIFGDTTETGERLNLNRVYRLHRGSIYLMDQTVFANYPIRLVADGDDSQRPPILVRGKYPTGDPIKTFFTFTGNNQNHTFENIIFTGVDEDREYLTQWNRGLKVAGDNVRLSLSHCIMNAWAGLFLEVTGDNTSLFIRDSEWRNGVGAQAPPWGAQQNVVFSNHLDTIIFTNNTVFNTGGFWLFQEDGIADFVKVEHNTLFTGLIDQIRMRDFVNTDFRSNLFYGTHAYGQTTSEQNASWFDKDGAVLSMFSIDTSGIDLLSANGLTEADKRIVVSHNTYFSPQAMVDWWATIANLNAPVWMHERTMAMFADDTNYPLLEAYENHEMDPLFVDTDMEEWIVDEVITYCDQVRKGLGVTSRNYDEHTGTADILILDWPLPENLVYTNAEMLIGGHDGLPVGDLNWYPEKRLEYTEGPVSIKVFEGHSRINTIEKIHPNPADVNIMVDLSFESRTTATIDILNADGRIIKSIPTQIFSQGNHSLQIDISDITAGAYILQVQSQNNISTSTFIKK